jgi:glycogen operon protein
MSIVVGRADPLGASLEREGVNFAVFSRHGTRAILCLYDPADPAREVARHVLPGRTGHVFHGFVPGAKVGTPYGFRVEGPYAPEQGHRFNGNKLLLDPYARAIVGRVDLKGPIQGYQYDGVDEDLSFDPRDSADAVPRSLVVDESFDWGDDRAPVRDRAESVIYELHVKGFTRRHPGVPEALRGTYLGLAHPAAIDYLRGLGVTAVELLPAHAFADDGGLVDRGLVNYWGYNTLAYFAPHAAYAVSKEPGAAVREFKEMVKALHAAGFEVLLDVVYNHTFEGNHKGPTLSFRGLDNASYYLASRESARYVMEFSGCGNCLDLRSPYALRLVLDSLRYWAVDMRVDGFRVDLASVLGREGAGMTFDEAAGFFRAVHQDPVLSRKKLIAEPWDLREGGYQLGHYPVLWSEWNGQFRDILRHYWLGDADVTGQVAERLTGSSDLFAPSGRGPAASINYVTCHDGFTLHDLVTYSDKHNEGNRDGNRDGADDNLSCNHGVEGETTDGAVRELRERQKRNLLTTLVLARGVPMLTAGDEIGRTQRGNNNAYCLDDESTWLDWELDDGKRALLAFTRRLIALRAELDVLRGSAFFSGDGADDGRDTVRFYRPDGAEMTSDDWRRRSLQVAFERTGEPGVLLLLNADTEPRVFTIPPIPGSWTARLDTRSAEAPAATPRAAGASYELAPRSVAVFVGA